MRSRAERWLRELTGSGPAPWWLTGLRGLARAGSWLYGGGAYLAALPWDLRLKTPRRLPVPVVGVGNLSAGGAGKTPLVAALVRALLQMGLPAGVLSRGYGGSASRGVRVVSVGQGPVLGVAQAGDEPVLLARQLPVPVAVGVDRFVAGRVLLAACGPRVLVADDLFQHRRLHRDLNLLALPLDRPPWQDAPLPRGTLREPLGALRRAQAVVLTRADDQAQVRRARIWLRSHWGPGPVLACRHRLAGLRELAGRELPPAEYAGAPVLAFCGLARPESFSAGLAGLGLEVRRLEPFADHHRFTPAELGDLWQRARELDCRALVTSEKDAVRLPPLPAGARVWVTRLELEFQGGLGALQRLLAWGLAGWEAR